MSSENQCTICKKVGHEPSKCHFRCVGCADNGVFHSKTTCPQTQTNCVNTCPQTNCVKACPKVELEPVESAPKPSQKSESCTVCGKSNHSTEKCKFACAKCAANGNYHSKNMCPFAPTVVKEVAATCGICKKPNHKEEKCHFRCVSCADKDVFHSKAVACP